MRKFYFFLKKLLIGRGENSFKLSPLAYISFLLFPKLFNGLQHAVVKRPARLPKLLSGFVFLIGILPTSIIFAQTTQTFTASGNFVVPAGVTSVTVEAWGGGGGGKSGTTGPTGIGGSGGGGGAFSTGNIAVTSGSTLSITVGAGGTKDNNGSASVVSTISANGGVSGGPGGTATGGTTNTSGSSGATNSTTTGGNGGNAAGPGGGVGGTGGVSGSVGTNGAIPAQVWLV
jgi:hypothetical protein